MKELVSPKESVLEFERFIVSEYLRYGSVDEILRANRFKNLGVSYPGIYHILKRWGVVRSLGRASLPLTETLEFLVRAIEGKVPIQTLYRRMPPSFQPTLATVHRVDIQEDARTHYHKKLTEIYVILEGEGSMELDGQLFPIKPMTAIFIKPGCRHRAVGKMTIINVAIPAFDPSDEWFD